MLRPLRSTTPTQNIQKKKKKKYKIHILTKRPDWFALDTDAGQESDDDNSDEKFHSHGQNWLWLDWSRTPTQGASIVHRRISHQLTRSSSLCEQ